MKSSLKNCLALLLITLVAGFALAAVNGVTAKPIENAEYQAKMDGYSAVYPNAKFVEGDAKCGTAPDGKCTINDYLVATDDSGKTIGYVMSATSPSGYGGDVTLAIGVSCTDDTITGVQILSQSETAGLGARCTEEEFQSQFKGKSAKGINYVKDGADTDTEIDAISGATITSNAVTEAVNAALDFYNNTLKEGK